MNLPYFYEENIQQPVHVLSEETSKHCVQVLRMKAGEQLQLTDGKGSLFTATIINADKKKSIVNAITGAHIGAITKGFTDLLITKNREAVLPEILPAFIEQYKVLNNIHTVKLTTAVPVSDQIKNTIVDQVKKVTGEQNIELEETVNPDIIGGFVLEMGDKMVDASVSYDLKAIAKQFKNNDFIYKVR